MFYRMPKFGSVAPAPHLFWNDLDAYGANFSHQTTRVEYQLDANGFMNAGWFNCFLTSGKYYWEILLTELTAGDFIKFGYKNAYDGPVRGGDDFAICQVYITAKVYDAGWYSTGVDSTLIRDTGDVTSSNTGSSASVQGDRIMFALDLDNGKAWFGKNGTWFNSGNPAAGTNAQLTTMPLASDYPWQLQMAGRSISGDVISFNTCFNGSPFAQAYTTPVGFTSGIPAPVANFYPAWSPRKATAFGTSHYRHTSDTLNAASWQSLATAFVGDDGYGGSVAPMLVDGKYYFEMRSSGSAGADYRFGVQDFESWLIGDFAFEWREDGTVTSDYGSVDLTGVSGYAVDHNCMVAVNNATGKIWLGYEGTWFNSGDPAAGTNPQITGLPNQKWGVNSAVAVTTGGWIMRFPSNFSYAEPAGFNKGIPSCLVP